MSKAAVLHYGMGLDSSSWLVDFLTNSKSKFRNFDLAAVLISQTGSESVLIKNQVEKFIFPLLRKHRIRTVQIARKSSTLKDGYCILEDTLQPYICHIEPTTERPYFTLEDEMLLCGSVPQFAGKRRRCSQKFKAKILDSWHAKNCPGCSKIIGFDASEAKRIEKYDENQQMQHPAVFPLYEQGWNRDYIKQYLRDFSGKDFYRSACYFCPFSQTAGSTEEIATKWALQPIEGAKAAYMEYVSLCFNPKQCLSNSKKSIIQRCLLSKESQELFELQLNQASWKIYKVRRINGLNIPYRSVEIVSVGSRSEMQSQLQQHGLLAYCQHGIGRYHIPLESKDCEEFLVAAPGNPSSKERKSFRKVWDRENGAIKQLSLF